MNYPIPKDTMRRNRLARPLLVGALGGLLAIISLTASAEAQRGREFALHEPAPKTRSTGYPGFADTNLAGKNSWVVDIFGFVDYGVNEKLTIGTNAFALIPLLDGSPAGYFKVRYQFYSSPRTTSVINFLGGYLSVDTREPDSSTGQNIRMGLGLLSSNTSIHRPWGVLSASLHVARLQMTNTAHNERLSREVTETIEATAFAGFVSFEHFFNRYLGMQLTAGSIPVLLGATDSLGGTASVSVASVDSATQSALARALLHLRVGRWLLSGGMNISLFDPETRGPWLNATWSN